MKRSCFQNTHSTARGNATDARNLPTCDVLAAGCRTAQSHVSNEIGVATSLSAIPKGGQIRQTILYG